MLVFRDKSGEVEIHNQFDEIMIVIGGKATVVTGGTAKNIRTLRPGELRGTSILDGTQNPMEKGNMVHIPVNTPHQVFVPAGGSVTYIDVKIEHPKG
jgi:mannose-6-phosphate isomerase-like protein (cupin superfamily)